MNDLFEYTEKRYPDLEKVLHNQEQFNTLLYDTPPAMQNVFAKIQKENEENYRRYRRNLVNEQLRSLPIVTVNGKDYVAIEDVLELV